MPGHCKNNQIMHVLPRKDRSLRQRFSLLYVLKSDLKKNIANKVKCGHQSSQLGRGATLKLNYLLHTLLNANQAAENDNSKLQYAVCDFI